MSNFSQPFSPSAPQPTASKPVTDSQARSAARRAGYVLRKSRRGFSIDNFGGYQMIDPDTGFVYRGVRYDLDPEDVIEICNA